MQKVLFTLLFAFVAVFGIYAQSSLKSDQDAKNLSDTYISAILKGIDSGDRNLFLNYCSDDFKTKMTPDIFTGMKANLSQNFGKIKSRVYLGYVDNTLKSTYLSTIIWKASFDKMNALIVIMLVRVNDKLLIDGVQIQ